MRGAKITGNTLNIEADWVNSTTVDIFAPKSVEQVTLNGIELQTERTDYGSLVGKLQSSSATVASVLAQLPSLDGWKAMEAMPERKAEYDDSRWIGRSYPGPPTKLLTSFQTQTT